MKGFAAILTIAVIGVIVSITAVVMILMPLAVLRMHMIETVTRVYEYDNTQSSLLTLLSKTHDGELVYPQISDNLQTGMPSVNFLKDELDTITGDKCYKLLSSVGTIVIKEGCTPRKYSAQTKIVLPYNPDRLTETLKLVVD